MCLCFLPWPQETSTKGNVLWHGMDSYNLPAVPWGHKSPLAANTAQEMLFVFSGTQRIPAWMKEISWVKRSTSGNTGVIPHIHLQEQCFVSFCIYCSGKREGLIRLSPPGLGGHVHEWVIQTKQVKGSARTWMEDGELVIWGEAEELGFFSSAQKQLRGEMSAVAHES